MVNLQQEKKRVLSLSEIAAIAMVEKGFIPEFPEGVLEELAGIKEAARPPQTTLFRDMREELWVSIDNDDSRDLDQLTFAEKKMIYVAIADVDALVKKDSQIDLHAGQNTTSVYTPTRVFSMLPLQLSTDLTSLNEQRDRCAIVTQMEVGADGRFELVAIYPAWVRNKGKLTYNAVGACLEGKAWPDALLPFREQLELQHELAQKIQHFRDSQGALQFAEIKLQPVIEKGVATGLTQEELNPAHKLIENFMIAANVGVTRHLNRSQQPTLRRVVRTPERWDRIANLARDLGEKLPSEPDAKALRAFLLGQQARSPDSFPDLSLAIIKLIGKGEYVAGEPGQKGLSHFDLAEIEYAHTTAPNRRFPDLVMQRLLKSSLYGEAPPYSIKELVEIAAHCTLKEDDATKVERRLVKCAAAQVMQKEVGRIFKGMITGASEKGTWVRLEAPRIEGKLIHGFQGLDVGDYVNVKLVHVDVLNGFIDFHLA